MESRVKLLGHPVHQMLVPIPAGLFIVGAVLDIIQTFAHTSWIPTVTFWNIAIGIGTALLAAPFGTADYLKVPRGTRARRVGAIHGIANVGAVVLFALALWIRADVVGRSATGLALALEVLAFAVLGVAAWLGGELVDRLGVGVDDGANLDAPSSLNRRPLTTTRR